MIEKAHLPEGSVVSIADYKGRRLFRLPGHETAPLGGPVKSVPQQGLDEGVYERICEDGIFHIYAFKRLSIRGGSLPYLTITAGIPKDAYMQAASHEISRNLLILWLAAFDAVVLAWLFADFALIKPIDRLVAAAHRLGGGDKTARTPLAHTTDELGQLAEAIDNMASRLETEEMVRRQAQKALVESEKGTAPLLRIRRS